ncbi:hypothetical protein PVAND_005523 [Polypedilum vanderplanki]|uniref:Uncharacterized protein n=1 Tax=Polypedilum vanderplanki TaxID=319348 RepID=A0A9J6C1F1_POLVA|nr:hypothetical protein PVAND_005523 [Polypedilum vanderplanki]
MSNRRPRRSRIYDLNYNIGENYYKSALDRLDEKSSRPASVLLRGSEPPSRSRISQLVNDADIQEDLELARDRASRAIRRETILDERSGRRGLEIDGDFDSQVQRTLERIQASKKLLNNIDVENGYDVNNELASSSVIKKRSLKIVSDVSSSSAVAQSNSEFSKYSKLGSSAIDDSESFAALRARQSAARLQDIEQDMHDRSERQFLREQRAANVKKLLAESSDLADDDYASSLKLVKSTQKRITSY